MRYRIAEFELEPDVYRITVDGEEVPVEPQVFDVLVHLIANRDRIVSKNELLDEVWGDRFVSESTLTSRIKTARRTLGDDGATQRMIRTVHGRGYQFVHPVEDRAAVSPHRAVVDRLGIDSVPIPPTTLIGREAELAEIAERLSTSRVVTVLGPGGVGKTRLAIEAANRAQEVFTDGVVYVELDRVGEAAEVRGAIAAELHVSPDMVGDVSSTSLLRDLHLLLVLDNFEHVLAAAPLVATLVASTHRLVVLTTSRERLRLAAESILDVEPFGTRPGEEDALVLYERTVDRVASGRADDRGLVADICRAVDGLPLAIELAAAATRTVPPELVLRRLRSNLLALEGDLHDRPARHRTMVAAIASSVDSLPASQRRLLAHLSVFAAPVPVGALTVVCEAGMDETLADLANLVDKSLVRPQAGPDRDAWFVVLRLIREYGRTLLVDAGLEPEVCGRHAEEIAATLTGLEEQRWLADASPWVAIVSLRYGDAVAAYRWARSTGDLDLAARVVAPLYAFWHRMGHHDQAAPWIAESLAHVGDEVSPTAAMLHLGAGYSAWSASDLAAAGQHWGDALTMWQALGRARYEAFCLSHLAGLSIDVADEYHDAIAMNAEATEIARATGEAPLLAQVLNMTGELARVQADHVVAEAAYEEALGVLGDAGDRQFESIVTSNLAALAADAGDLDRALELGRAALDLSADVGQWMTSAFCITNLGCVEHRLGWHRRAARLLGAADGILRRLAATRHVADRPDYDRAIAGLRQSLGEDRLESAMAKGAGLSFGEAVTLAMGTGDESSD